MTTVAEEVKEGSSPELRDVPESTAQSRACARESVTPPASVTRDAVTQSARAARQAAVRAVAILDKPGSLAHSQPPTFAQARDRHHECAGHFSAPVLRWLRLTWGYAHLLLLKPALNLAEWITESPARLFITAALAAAVWFWS